MIEIIEVFVAHGDGGERGAGPIIGICDTKINAEIIAKGRAFYGGDGYVSPRKAIKNPQTGEVYLLDTVMCIPVNINEDIPKQKKVIKEEALAKLTMVEREVLGLNK